METLLGQCVHSTEYLQLLGSPSTVEEATKSLKQKRLGYHHPPPPSPPKKNFAVKELGVQNT